MFNQFAKHEDAFRDWRRDGLPGLRPESYKYVEFLTSEDDDREAREGTLWPHQWESFLRVVYAHETLGRTEVGADGLLLNIVTGGGKTAVIAAVTAWLRIAHGVQKFVMLCPNLIVRDRLQDDFQNGKVFKDRGLLPDWTFRPEDFSLTTLGGGGEGGWASLLGASVVLGNIHQFYQSNKSGQSNLSALMNGPEFALFNDEAHNSPAPEYEQTLARMRDKVTLRVDTTATPDRADGKTPDSDMIFEYGVSDALFDGVIKTPVVYQPDIRTVQLTYTDARTGERREVEEIDWDEVDRLGLNATQWVTDDRTDAPADGHRATPSEGAGTQGQAALPADPVRGGGVQGRRGEGRTDVEQVLQGEDAAGHGRQRRSGASESARTRQAGSGRKTV